MPKDSSNRARLAQDLLREEDLHFLYKQVEFRRTLLPLLHKELSPPLLNPKDFPSQDRFLEAYNQALGKPLLAKALLELFKGAEGRAQKIRQLLETPEKDFGVGN
jgi:hypothetical protein